MDRRRLAARQFGHPFGRAARRRRQQCLQAQLLEEREDGEDRGRLPRARAACDQHELVFQRKLQGPALHGGEAQPRPVLHGGEDRRELGVIRILRPAHGGQTLGRPGLRLVERGQIAGAAARDLLVAKPSGLNQRRDALVRALRLDADQLARDYGELFPRDEAMAVARVVRELEKQRCLDAHGAVGIQPQLVGHDVRFAEAPADLVVGEDIRIVPQKLQRLIAVKAVESHRQHRAKAEGADELHQSAHAELAAKALRHQLRLARADPAEFRELFRLALEHVERLVPELAYDHGGRRRSDPADRAAGEELVDRVGGARQQTLRILGLELLPVHRVRRPRAADDHRLPRRRVGKGSHDGDDFAVLVGQAQDGIAVFFIFEDDGIDGARQFREFKLLIHGAQVSCPAKISFKNCPV